MGWVICKQFLQLALKAGLDMDMVGEGFLTTTKKIFAGRKSYTKTN